MLVSEYIKVNMAICPPENIARVARKFSNQCPGGNKAFTLSEVRIPHITIYYAEFPIHNLPALINTVEDICNNTKRFELVFDKAELSYNYFFALFKKTKEIIEFHQKFLDLINPLREGHLKEKYMAGSPEWEELSPEHQKSATAYGHLNTGASFSPHLTLTYYKDKLPILSEMPGVFFDTFTAEKLIIFTGGDNGTSERIVKEFNLTAK